MESFKYNKLLKLLKKKTTAVGSKIPGDTSTYVHIKQHLLSHVKDCTSWCTTQMKDREAASGPSVNTGSE